MAHHRIDLQGKDGYYDMDPVFEFNGLELRVKSGAFVWAGVNYSIAEDQVVLFEENTNTGFKVQVRGYLVEDSGNPGVLELLVDEVSTDPNIADEWYDFGDPNNTYTMIHDLLHFNLYPNSTDIEAEGINTPFNGFYFDGDIVSYHYVVPPAP